MAEKKRKKETDSSSSLIPEQSSRTLSERIRRQQESQTDKWSRFKKRQRRHPAPRAASKKIQPLFAQPVRSLSRVSPSVSVKSYSSMNKPPSFHPQKTQRSQLSEKKSAADCTLQAAGKTLSQIIAEFDASEKMVRPPRSQLSEKKSAADCTLQAAGKTLSQIIAEFDASEKMVRPPRSQLSEKKSAADCTLQAAGKTLSQIIAEFDASEKMVRPPRSQLSEKKSAADCTLQAAGKTLSQIIAEFDASEKMVRPPRSQLSEKKSAADCTLQAAGKTLSQIIAEFDASEKMVRPPRRQQESQTDKWSRFKKRQRRHPAPRAASKKIQPLFAQPVRSLSRVSPSVSVKSYSSMNKPPSFHPQKTQRSQLSEKKSAADCTLQAAGKTLSQIIAEFDASEKMVRPPSSARPSAQAPRAASNEMRHPSAVLVRPLSRVSPSVSVKSYSSMNKPPSFHPQKTQSEPLRETDSAASRVSVKSESSMFEPPDFHLQREQSEPLRETDSTVSHVSMKSDSSMFEPPSFKLKRKQSCSVCEEAVKDPVRLLCGHRACKQCVCSHWDRYGSTADYPCKKCGKRFRGHQTDTEDNNKNLNLPSAPRPAPENTTKPVRREKRDQVLQSVLLEKTIRRVEMETEKLQAQKETFELKKRKLALEIQLLEQKCSSTNYGHGVLIENTISAHKSPASK